MRISARPASTTSQPISYHLTTRSMMSNQVNSTNQKKPMTTKIRKTTGLAITKMA